MKKREIAFYFAAALTGILVWVYIASESGRREAWDAPTYYSLGIPVICVISFVLAFFEPKNWWRWGVVPFAGQLLWALVTLGFGNLFPLGGIVFGVLSLPAVLAAWIGAWAGKKVKR